MEWSDVTRLGAFLVVLLGLAGAEIWWPRRHHGERRRTRWPGNVGLVVLDTILVRTILPLGVVGVALWAEGAGVGVFHSVSVPGWIAFPATVVLLDLTVYAQHVLLHRVPWLWRLHRVHHADVDVDVTTGLRFHPAEMVLSLVLKGAVVTAVGGGAAAVLAFEVLLNLSSMFTHANVALPAQMDRVARALLVTPDMHRVHHSVRRDECSTNFGFMLSWWDRLFGTYRAQPAGGHDRMTLGLDAFRGSADQRLHRLLAQPWRASAPRTPRTG